MNLKNYQKHNDLICLYEILYSIPFLHCISYLLDIIDWYGTLYFQTFKLSKLHSVKLLSILSLTMYFIALLKSFKTGRFVNQFKTQKV